MAMPTALCAQGTCVHDKLSLACSGQHGKTRVRQTIRLAWNRKLIERFPLANTLRAKQPKRLFAECARGSLVVSPVKQDCPCREGIEQMLAAIPLRIEEPTAIVISEPRDCAA